MTHSRNFGHALAVLVVLLPLVALAALYPSLPETVPVHYNASMEAEDFAAKQSLWLLHGGLSAMSLLIYFLLRNLHLIDPKRAGREPSSTFNKLATGLVVILSVLQVVILTAAAGYQAFLKEGIFVTLGALFVLLGNYMHSVRPNYFVGFRLPWTLESEENWRLTHRLVGKLWVAAGVALAVCGIVLDGRAMAVALVAIIGLATVAPIMYSWRIFRERKAVESGG